MQGKCNLLKPISATTGTYFMFSQYSEDLTKSLSQQDSYRVVPSKSVALNLNIGEFNEKTLAELFQNYYENACTFLRAKLENNWDPTYASYLLWQTLAKGGLVTSTQYDTNNTYYPEVVSINSIDIQNHKEYGDGIGYNEVYCYIPNDAKRTIYINQEGIIRDAVNDNLLRDGNYVEYDLQYICGYNSNVDEDGNLPNGLSGFAIADEYDVTINDEPIVQKGYNIHSFIPQFLLTGETNGCVLTQDDEVFYANAIVVLYDIIGKDENGEIRTIYTNIPMGIYFTGTPTVVNREDIIEGVFDTANQQGVEIVIYPTDDEESFQTQGYTLTTDNVELQFANSNPFGQPIKTRDTNILITPYKGTGSTGLAYYTSQEPRGMRMYSGNSIGLSFPRKIKSFIIKCTNKSGDFIYGINSTDSYTATSPAACNVIDEAFAVNNVEIENNKISLECSVTNEEGCDKIWFKNNRASSGNFALTRIIVTYVDNEEPDPEPDPDPDPDTFTTLTNYIVKYVKNEDIYNQGTSYGLRICNRFLATPYDVKLQDTEVQSFKSMDDLTSVMAAFAENASLISKVIATNTQTLETLNSHLSSFRNHRTNVPYIRALGNENYWFVNGKNTGVKVNATVYNVDNSTHNGNNVVSLEHYCDLLGDDPQYIINQYVLNSMPVSESFDMVYMTLQSLQTYYNLLTSDGYSPWVLKSEYNAFVNSLAYITGVTYDSEEYTLHVQGLDNNRNKAEGLSRSASNYITSYRLPLGVDEIPFDERKCEFDTTLMSGSKYVSNHVKYCKCKDVKSFKTAIANQIGIDNVVKFFKDSIIYLYDEEEKTGELLGHTIAACVKSGRERPKYEMMYYRINSNDVSLWKDAFLESISIVDIYLNNDDEYVYESNGTEVIANDVNEEGRYLQFTVKTHALSAEDESSKYIYIKTSEIIPSTDDGEYIDIIVDGVARIKGVSYDENKIAGTSLITKISNFHHELGLIGFGTGIDWDQYNWIDIADGSQEYENTFKIYCGDGVNVINIQPSHDGTGDGIYVTLPSPPQEDGVDTTVVYVEEEDMWIRIGQLTQLETKITVTCINNVTYTIWVYNANYE